MDNPEADALTQLPRILAVDHNAADMQDIVGLLKNDFAVLQASDSQEALRILDLAIPCDGSRTSVQVVILDALTAGLDGFTLCRRIKKEFQVPVIMCDVPRGVAEIQAAIRNGADDFLAKPLRAPLLQERISRLIGLRDRPRAAALSDQRPTVLLVDDDALFRRLAILQLGRHYRMLEAANAAEAMAQLDHAQIAGIPECTIRAVLLDIMMPGIDGLSLLHRIKGEFNVPVIMCTARTNTSDIQQAIRNGADDYVAKPFNAGVLLEKLNRVLHRRQT
jgi:DNA-binding response OmpR family regulator